MTFYFLVSLALIALCVLWLPTYSLALLLRSLGAPQPFADLKTVMPAQLLAAIVLIGLASAMGLRNPAGYSLAILLLVSLTGAVIVWRRRYHGI